MTKQTITGVLLSLRDTNFELLFSQYIQEKVQAQVYFTGPGKRNYSKRIGEFLELFLTNWFIPVRSAATDIPIKVSCF